MKSFTAEEEKLFWDTIDSMSKLTGVDYLELMGLSANWKEIENDSRRTYRKAERDAAECRSLYSIQR